MAIRELTAIPLMQIISGFWASKTLAAAVELDLFTQLSGRGVDIRELGQLLQIHPRPAEMLLSGCASLGLLEKRGERYHNSPLSEEFLVRGKPYYFGGVVSLLDRRLYLPWNRLPEAIKTNCAQTWKDQPGIFEAMSASPEEQRIFTEGMHSFSVQSGEAVAAAFDFMPYAYLLDVGGGSGAYCIEAARRYPHLRATVFDLPAALEIAREKIAEAGFADRIKTHPGDFFNEELPKGADVVLLSMILHDWTPEKNRAILKRCFDALPSGGAVIVSELMMNDEKTGPISAALMSLNMLIETEGRNYTWAEYTAWLKEVGFREIQGLPVESPGANGILVGRKR
ncbi:MAG TPA: methyltransferase [Candidatus Methylomirabilis sp.]|nr:methyltransferase [Candidatus Methylomirabilis sp.]